MSDLLLTVLGVLLVAVTAAIGLSSVRRRIPTPTAPDVARELELERVVRATTAHAETIAEIDARATLSDDDARAERAAADVARRRG